MANCCTLQNSRGDLCPSIMDIAKRLIIVPEVDGSGAQNKFASEAAVTKSALQAKFDAADKDDRFFPLSIIENVEDLRAEPTFFEFNSGRKAKVKEGTRTFVAYIPFQGPEYLGKLEEWGCSKFGVYIVDKAGNFIYATDSSTKTEVLPILVDHESFSAELMKKTDGEPIMIKLTFDFRETEKDSLLRAIDKDSLDFDGLSSTDVYGLWDITHAVTSITTTGFVSTITSVDYGFAIEGLVPGDFSLYNDTDSASVTITSATESATVPGEYTFVIPAQTSADSMTLSMTKAGYDDAPLEAVKVVIP
jgi:hypothetical protein